MRIWRRSSKQQLHLCHADNREYLLSELAREKNGEFLSELKDFKRVHKSVLIILTEPKISGIRADEVCKKLGKSH